MKFLNCCNLLKISLIFTFVLQFSINAQSTNTADFSNKKATLLSAALPGLGQIYNGDYLKSGSFIFLGTYAVIKRNEYNEINQLNSNFCVNCKLSS